MSEVPKHPGGRPTKYDPKYCQMLIEHGAQGHSFESFAAVIDVHEDTLYEWVQKFPEFSDYKKRSKVLKQLFYEKLGIKASQGGIENFNATAFVWMTKNMLKWRDRQDIELSGKQDGAPIQIHNASRVLSDDELKTLAAKALESNDLSTKVILEGE